MNSSETHPISPSTLTCTQRVVSSSRTTGSLITVSCVPASSGTPIASQFDPGPARKFSSSVTTYSALVPVNGGTASGSQLVTDNADTGVASDIGVAAVGVESLAGVDASPEAPEFAIDVVTTPTMEVTMDWFDGVSEELVVAGLAAAEAAIAGLGSKVTNGRGVDVSALNSTVGDAPGA
jgi:hypothetical protein